VPTPSDRDLQHRIRDLLEDVVEAQGCELVAVVLTRIGGRRVLRLHIDRPGGVGLEACRRVSLAGGVAANSRLRARLRLDAGAERMDVYLPSLQLCGDNAAMVAALGYRLLAAGKRGRLADDVFSKAG